MRPASDSDAHLVDALSHVREQLADPGAARAVLPKLRELGLTLPGFIDRGRVIASLPSLGLLTLAAHTPPHWQVEYREVDTLSEEDIGAIEQERFDVVALSSLTARITDAYVLADRLRAAGTIVVLGGLHATALPDEALRHVDVVVQGEGEHIWPALLGDLERGALQQQYTSLGLSGRAHILVFLVTVEAGHLVGRVNAEDRDIAWARARAAA